MKKLSPKHVKICPACPTKDLTLDLTPKFNFIFTPNNDTKKINIFKNPVSKIKSKINTLF